MGALPPFVIMKKEIFKVLENKQNGEVYEYEIYHTLNSVKSIATRRMEKNSSIMIYKSGVLIARKSSYHAVWYG